MSNRSIATLAFRLAGLYALVQAIQQSGSISELLIIFFSSRERFLMWSALTGGNYNRVFMFIGGLLPFTILCVLAAILILRSDRFARRMFPQSDLDIPENRFLGIHALAYSIVGIFIIASSLPNFIRMAIPLVIGPGAQPANSSIWAAYGMRVICDILQIGLGLYLFFGSHGLARLWSRLRYSGLRRQMGLCIRCGYDLTGNTTGVCPECGTHQNVNA